MNWNHRNLSRHDWDFSGVRDEELEECATYEFLREVDSFREKVLEVREKEGIPDFKEAHSFFGTDTSLPPYFFPAALFFREDWPEKPYQSLPWEKRKEMFVPVEAVIDPSFSLKKTVSLLETEDLEDREVELGETLRFPDRDPAKVVAAFEIDWRSTNTEIMRGIKAWLENHRPGDAQTADNRGAGAPIRQRKDDLKALGIWRIQKAYGGDRIKAFTKLGVELGDQYNHSSAWTKATKHAEEAIANFEDLSLR